MDDAGAVIIIVVGDDHAQHGTQYPAHHGTVITVDGMADQGAGTGADDRARQFVGSRGGVAEQAQAGDQQDGGDEFGFQDSLLGLTTIPAYSARVPGGFPGGNEVLQGVSTADAPVGHALVISPCLG
jgi:hypothetical protein